MNTNSVHKLACHCALTQIKRKENLPMREMMLQDAGENCIMLSFLICTAYKSRHTSWLGHVVHIGEIIN